MIATADIHWELTACQELYKNYVIWSLKIPEPNELSAIISILQMWNLRPREIFFKKKNLDSSHTASKFDSGPGSWSESRVLCPNNHTILPLEIQRNDLRILDALQLDGKILRFQGEGAL